MRIVTNAMYDLDNSGYHPLNHSGVPDSVHLFYYHHVVHYPQCLIHHSNHLDHNNFLLHLVILIVVILLAFFFNALFINHLSIQQHIMIWYTFQFGCDT